MKAGKRRLAGDTARPATADAVKDLRIEASAMAAQVISVAERRRTRPCSASPTTFKLRPNITTTLL